MKFIGKILMSTLAVALAELLLPGVHLSDFSSSILVALVLALLNSFLKPILIILTIPFTLITFGFFLLVINAFMIWIADELIEGFQVDGFWWAIAFSLLLSIITSIFERIDKNNNRQKPTQNSEQY